VENLFFVISKLAWALISPDSLIVILVLVAWLALVLGWQKISRWLLSAAALMILIIAFLPVGEWLILPLEKRFPANAALPLNVDGIIVLGGAMDPVTSAAWMQPELNDSADRLTSFQYLARLYPEAQLIFTGGSGSLVDQQYKEADAVQSLFNQMGLQDRAILLESESRNTFENARNSKQLVSPRDGEEWILITSAFHMPRSVGIFCAQNWPVHPYPVDHYARRDNLMRIDFSFAHNLRVLRTAMREWVGLLAYRTTGRSTQLLPDIYTYCAASARTDN